MDDRSYLIHYGIIGQKWGIRRYQNFDGSYTKKGLERYGKSKAKYEQSRDAYKAIKKSGNKEGLSSARRQMRIDRKRMNKDYRHLKQDKLGDQGRELYQQGKTIGGEHLVLPYKVFGVNIAALAARTAVANSPLRNTTLLTKYGSVNVADLTGAAIAVGGNAVIAGMRIHQYDIDRKLRAYYGHSSKY